MRNISFAITTEQYENGSKDVTRRLGWKNLKAGDRLQAVRKIRGLPKGAKVERLNPPVIEVVSVRRERLDRMTKKPRYGRKECRREGFPDLSAEEFVAMFCEHGGCQPRTFVTRIEFRRFAVAPRR